MSTTELDAAEIDRERRFGALVDYAEQIGVWFDGLLQASGNDESPSRAEMPAGLLFELTHLTRLQLEAACHDLRNPWLSHAAPTHLRPLIEGMALVAFVLGHETDNPVGRAEQRAICVSLARMYEEHSAMAAAQPDHVPNGNLAESQSRIDILEQMHQSVGCAYANDPRDWPCRKTDGSPCDHRSAWPCRLAPMTARKLTSITTRLLSARMEFHFREIEQAASLVLHMMLADRLWRDTGQGTNEFANASYVMRASTLAMAFSAAGVTLTWVIETLSAPAGKVLRDYIAAMWKLPDIVEIGTGAWDPGRAH